MSKNRQAKEKKKINKNINLLNERRRNIINLIFFYKLFRFLFLFFFLDFVFLFYMKIRIFSH